MMVEHGIPKLVLPSLGLKHRLHTHLLKKASLKELSNTLKIDRTEHFDDYYPCIRFGCDDLSHVYKWLAGPICIYA